LIQFHLIK